MNIFQQLEQLALEQETTSMQEDRIILTQLVDFFLNQPWQQEYIEWFCELRDLKLKAIQEARGFMVDEDFGIENLPEDFLHERFGFVRYDRLVFSGRFVFPVQDTTGQTMGFIGYNKTYEEDEESKYLDSINIGYRAKRTTLLGMEKLEAYYNSNHVFITEGSMCMYYLRGEGLNALSALGSNISPYVAEIINRFGMRAIWIADSDEAGNKFVSKIKRCCPRQRIIQMLDDKDVDAARKLNPSVVDELRSYTTKPFGKYTSFIVR